MILSPRAQLLKPSATLAITAKAKAMRADGMDVIGFGAGEPDFSTPSHILESAVDAMRAGETRYTPVGGTPELKSAIIQRTLADYGIEFEPCEVTASCGAKHTLFNLFMVLAGEGDEVLIPAPYWVSYPDQVAIAGATPVIIEAREDEGFSINLEELRKKITTRSKIFILNSPCNPSGSMYDAEVLSAVADVLREYPNLVIVTDDIYQKLVYGEDSFVSILDVAPDLKHRVVIVNGVSKAYAMTGWRIGYAAGPRELIEAMEKLQSQSTSNPTSFAQKAACAALTGPQDCVSEMVKAFKMRRDYLVERLNKIDGVSCELPKGAFYAFPNISKLFGRVLGGVEMKNSFDVARYLLESALVAVVPGAPFGADDHMRLSYATSLESIQTGMDRIQEALS